MKSGWQTSKSAASTTQQTTTKNLLSLSAATAMHEDNGPSLIELLKSNSIHLSENIFRYTQFPSIISNVGALIRLVQMYCVFFMPSCTGFWNRDTKLYSAIVTFPTHLCIVPGSDEYHFYLGFALFVFFLISAYILFLELRKKMNVASISNSRIGWFRLFFEVLNPIFFCFICSNCGFCFKHIVFYHSTNAILYLSAVLQIFGIAIAVAFHFYGYIYDRSYPTLQHDLFMVPLAPYIKMYSVVELYLYVLAFLEEFLPLDKQMYTIVFSVLCMILNNPLNAYLVIKYPFYQDYTDTSALVTLFLCGFIGNILIIVAFSVYTLTPTIYFTVEIILIIGLTFTVRAFATRRISDDLKRLYSLYKHSAPVLPPTTPLVFVSPQANQAGLSRAAYDIMQKFSSLDIKNKFEFHRIMSIGAAKLMPGVTNLDFVKWGLNYFAGMDSLLICAQMCRCFNAQDQSLVVILQRITELDEISMFTTPLLTSLQRAYEDAISDHPVLMIELEKKVSQSLQRAKSILGSFWGSVLNHSSQTMKDNLCRLRDSIAETDTHFDELLRCYPRGIRGIGLYISFLTEVKGEFIACNRFINDISADFIEDQSEENDENPDAVKKTTNKFQDLIADPSKSYYHYVQNLGVYMEQERSTQDQTHGPRNIIVIFSILSAFFLIGCLVSSIVLTLKHFQKYPKILNVIKYSDDVVIQLATMTTLGRQICLFANGILDHPVDFGVEPPTRFDTFESSIDYVIELTNSLPMMIQEFFYYASEVPSILETVASTMGTFIIFEKEIDLSLGSIFDIMGLMNDLNIAKYAVWFPEHYALTKNETADDASGEFKLLDDEGTTPAPHVRPPPSSKEIHSNKTRKLAADFDTAAMMEIYRTTCQSAEMKQVLQNVDTLNLLVINFMSVFGESSKVTVNELQSLLFYLMVIMPPSFFVIFTVFLIAESIYLRNEASFRMTLYMSLPEQVASEIYRGGNKSQHHHHQQQQEGSEAENKEGEKKEPTTVTKIDSAENPQANISNSNSTANPNPDSNQDAQGNISNSNSSVNPNIKMSNSNFHIISDQNSNLESISNNNSLLQPISSSNSNAFIPNNGSNAFIPNNGSNAFISNNGSNAFLSTSGSNANISNTGSNLAQILAARSNLGQVAQANSTLQKQLNEQAADLAAQEAAEKAEIEEKTLTIETLHQITNTNSLIQSTGLTPMVIWVAIYLVIGALCMFALVYYSRSVNVTFVPRTILLTDAALRYAITHYSGLILREYFLDHAKDVKGEETIILPIKNRDSVLEEMLIKNQAVQKELTIGSADVPYDFRIYPGIIDLNYLLLDPTPPSYEELSTLLEPSSAGMVHHGYSRLGVDAIVRVFFQATRGLQNEFRNNDTIYIAGGNEWFNFNHVLFAHLDIILQDTVEVYQTGVHDVLNKVIVYSALIAVGSLALSAILYFGPILTSVSALLRFFTLTSHVIAQISLDVFQNSVYIQRWVKQTISRHNYRQYETLFNKRISPEVQGKVIDESNERIILFDTEKNFIDTGCIDTTGLNIEEASLEEILSRVVDLTGDRKVVDSIDTTMSQFLEAKDPLNPVSFQCKSLEPDVVLSLTVNGISGNNVNMGTSQHCYSAVAILIRDITKDAADRALYQTQLDRNINLLTCVVPKQLAEKIHAGDSRVSITVGIGTVLTVEIIDYEKTFAEIGSDKLPPALKDIRTMLDRLLAESPNVSMCEMKDGTITFVAGLFNDEQNGRTEALDTLQFAGKLGREIAKENEKFETHMKFKYIVSTGGPFYVKMLFDGEPLTIVSGEVLNVSHEMLKKCTEDLLLLDRTTFECIYGINITPTVVGDIDVHHDGKQITIYSVKISDIGDLQVNAQL